MKFPHGSLGVRHGHHKHCVNEFLIMEASTCGPERSLLSFILQNLAYSCSEALQFNMKSLDLESSEFVV